MDVKFKEVPLGMKFICIFKDYTPIPATVFVRSSETTAVRIIGGRTVKIPPNRRVIRIEI